MTTAAQLSENSHQGFDGIKAALCLASMEAKSNTASGMPLCLWQNGIGSRSSGKERDTETGLDYFMARYFSSAQGRFTSPDPLLASARLTDPQTWNRYAYVRNNPVNLVDPDGRVDINASVFQGLKSTFITGDMFNDWFRQSMGFQTINDFAGAASLPGYSGPDPALIAYFAQVDEGQENLRKIEQAKKEEAKKAEALPEGTVTIKEGSKHIAQGRLVCTGDAYVLAGNPDNVGKPGFPNVTVTSRSAAIIPRQFTGEMTAGPFLRAIGASTYGIVIGSNGKSEWFYGLDQSIGNADLGTARAAQDIIMGRAPGELVIEIVGGRHLGRGASVTINMPDLGQGCPEGTRPIP